MSDIEHDKRSARAFFDQVWTAGDVARVGDFIADHFTSHNPAKVTLTTPSEYAAAVTEFRAAFPDLITTVEDVFGEGDRVAVRGTDRGTHRGIYEGREPTGRTFELSWIEIFRMEGGKAVEGWVETDFSQVLAQLDRAFADSGPGDPIP